MHGNPYYSNYTVQPPPRNRFRGMSLIFVLVLIGGFSWLTWYAYKAGTAPTAAEDVPLVKSDGTPLRVKPQDPGGMDIPHRDKTVYEAITRSNTTAMATATAPSLATPAVAPEKIAPLSEEPAPVLSTSEREMAEARQKLLANITQPAATKTELLTASAEPETPAKPLSEPMLEPLPHKAEAAAQPSAPVTAPAMEKTPAAPAAPAVPIVAETVAPKAPSPKVVPKTGVRIQLGAFKSAAEAEGVWAKLKRQHAELLGNQQITIEKADLGAKGTFYRLQLVNLPNDAEAQSLCKKLEARKQGCFLVKK